MERHGTELDQSGGSFYGWRRGWPLPDLVTRPGGEVSIETAPPVELLARMAALPDSEVARRLNEGHHIFLLRVDGQPAAYGWSATGPQTQPHSRLRSAQPCERPRPGE